MLWLETLLESVWSPNYLWLPPKNLHDKGRHEANRLLQALAGNRESTELHPAPPVMQHAGPTQRSIAHCWVG